MRWLNYALVAVTFVGLLLAPFWLSSYNLTLLGRFLAMGILAVGISLSWGHTGILSLGQGVFFGLGAYALALHLKIVASAGSLPDFMLWNGVSTLPWWWQPFQNPLFAVAMVFVLPTAAAGLLAWLVFRRRITGVYFALITQALTLAFTTLLVSQQGTTGGFNGLTSFNTFFGFWLAGQSVQVGVYLITVGLLALSWGLATWLTKTHLGNLLVAIRDGENRTRFLGYHTSSYKVFIFALAGGLAGVAGALFTLQVGVISPAMIGVVPSIEMVIWVALGGRESITGAVLGAVLGNLVKDQVSSSFPDLWLYLIGALFVLIGTVLPKGLAGLIRSRQRRTQMPKPTSAPLVGQPHVPVRLEEARDA